MSGRGASGPTCPPGDQRSVGPQDPLGPRGIPGVKIPPSATGPEGPMRPGEGAEEKRGSVLMVFFSFFQVN